MFFHSCSSQSKSLTKLLPCGRQVYARQMLLFQAMPPSVRQWKSVISYWSMLSMHTCIALCKATMVGLKHSLTRLEIFLLWVEHVCSFT